MVIRCLTRLIKFGGLLGLVFTLKSSRVKFSLLFCQNIKYLVQKSENCDFRNKIEASFVLEIYYSAYRNSQ